MVFCGGGRSEKIDSRDSGEDSWGRTERGRLDGGDLCRFERLIDRFIPASSPFRVVEVFT